MTKRLNQSERHQALEKVEGLIEESIDRDSARISRLHDTLEAMKEERIHRDALLTSRDTVAKALGISGNDLGLAPNIPEVHWVPGENL